MQMKCPVFVSYSHDPANPEHSHTVSGLAASLMGNGLTGFHRPESERRQRENSLAELIGAQDRERRSRASRLHRALSEDVPLSLVGTERLSRNGLISINFALRSSRDPADELIPPWRELISVHYEIVPGNSLRTSELIRAATPRW